MVQIAPISPSGFTSAGRLHVNVTHADPRAAASVEDPAPSRTNGIRLGSNRHSANV